MQLCLKDIVNIIVFVNCFFCTCCSNSTYKLGAKFANSMNRAYMLSVFPLLLLVKVPTLEHCAARTWPHMHHWSGLLCAWHTLLQVLMVCCSHANDQRHPRKQADLSLQEDWFQSFPLPSRYLAQALLSGSGRTHHWMQRWITSSKGGESNL